MIQQQDQTDPIKFEIHMYHPTAMANAVTPTSWFYTLYVHTPSSIVQRDKPSRLEIAFLLDSGASISVLNYPTYITLTKLLDIRSNHTSDVGPTRNSKTLTVANQTEVPVLHYANIILNTTIDENSRYFSVPFAVADIKYNILGTPFFEDIIQNINIQDFTLEFKYQSKTHPTYTKFTTLPSKDYPNFSYIYRINSKTQIRLKPKSSKIAHFPIKIYHNLHFTTTPQNHFFPSVPHTYFATKFRTNFNFIEVFTDDKPDICATIIQNTSKHVATLPTGHIGYIEVPITNEKPKFFQVNDINTLIHRVTHTYHPDITEPLPQTNYIVQYTILLGIVHALQIYEFLIIGSPHPIHIFTDHKPLLHCFTKKGNLSPRFYRAQMQLTKFSKLKIIHTPGKNLSVADMLSRSFTKAELQLNQLKHKQLPPQIDFALLQDNTLKPVHYLIKHEEILPHQKHDSHPILADYGTDQFSIRINDKGNYIVVKSLQSFSFKSVTLFQTKFKTPTKKNNKTLHQQPLSLNDTDVTSDDEDHIYTRIPKSDSSFLQDTTLETENFSTLNQLTHITSQKPVSAINVQPNLPSLTHCQQIIPFYDTSFFKYKNYFQGFFLPDDYSLDIKTLQQQQSQDPVLRTVYSWLLNNEKPEFITPLITGTPFLHVHYKRFSQLFIDESTNLFSLYITNPTVINQSSTPNFVKDTIRICLPFRMFKTVFNKLHEHSHTGMKITYNTFKQYYYIPFLEKWLSIFIHDCIECQRNKHFNMKIQTAPTQSFSEHAPSFNYRISMDTKGPNNPPSHNKSYIHVIIDAFSHFVVTVPIKSNNAKTAIKTILHHWIIKFGPPIYLVTDRGSEYVNKEMAHLCTLMGIRHSPRTAYSPWPNGLVEVQNRNLGTHLRMFLHDTPKDWAFHVHMYAYAHNSQPLSELNNSPHEIVFHTRPKIPLTFDLNLNRDTSKICISRYCSQLPEHSHYDKSDLNPFFYRTLSKPIPHWFLAVETAMLQIYPTVYETPYAKSIHTHTLQKLTTKVSPFLLVLLF